MSNLNERRDINIRTVLLLAAVCLLAVLVFLLAYNKDNKYTVQGPQAVKGVLALDENTLAEYPLLFLVNGWEYYGGRLLTPQDFADAADAPAPDRHIYIGQYGGFEAGDTSASPHGSASYRLVLTLPRQPCEYTLELPEIYSAYRAYVNGRMVMQLGEPEPANYHPETGNRSVTFEAGGVAEILIAVSDFSHLYSGMTYPPAFGEPEAVASMLGARQVLRSVVCAVALTIALLAVLIGALSRRARQTVLYGLLCLCFVGYVSYPILQTFLGGFQPLYAIENICFCAMLLLAMWVGRAACGVKDRWGWSFLAFGGLCCVAAALLPFLAPTGSLVVLYGYSYLITAYEWITAGYLTFLAVRAVVKATSPSLPLLCGILVFDVALVMDRVLPLYEPIRGGWFIETANFVLVLSLGAVIAREVAVQYRDNAVLTERAASMERLAEMQQGYFTVLRQEMDETKAARHDMHHHFQVMEGMLQNKQYDELAAYTAGYSKAVYNSEPEPYCDNNVVNILAHYYDAIAEQNRIYLDIRCDLPGPLHVPDADLCGVLSNLLENAVGACLRFETGRRVIRVALADLGETLAIRVENTTDEVQQKGDAFVSSKGEGRQGYGLQSVRAIAARHGGSAKFTWDRKKRLFTAIVVL